MARVRARVVELRCGDKRVRKQRATEMRIVLLSYRGVRRGSECGKNRVLLEVGLGHSLGSLFAVQGRFSQLWPWSVVLDVTKKW